MKILVTGGTGFLGRHSAIRLKSRGHDVTILGRNSRIGGELEKRGIRFVKSDLDDAGSVIEACKGMDVVIHSGGYTSPSGKYEDHFKANVLGTRNVLAGCKKYGVKRLIHLSTPSLYFNYKDRLNISEDEPIPKPQTHYAATKLIADEEVERASHEGLETISLRPRGIFGPGDQSVLARLIPALGRGRMPLIGGGKSFVDLTYVDNVVDAIELSLKAPKEALGKAFNISNGEPMSTKEMIEKVSKHLGMDVKFMKLPFALAWVAAYGTEIFYNNFRSGTEPPLSRYAIGLMAKSQTLDISRARKLLGYEPKVSLDEGFTRFARWWKKKESGIAALSEEMGI